LQFSLDGPDAIDGSNRRTRHVRKPGVPCFPHGCVAMIDSPPSMIGWKCRGCGQDIRVPQQLAGKQLICPKCQARQIVPAAGLRVTGRQPATPAAPRGPAPAVSGPQPGPRTAGHRLSSRAMLLGSLACLSAAALAALVVSMATRQTRPAPSHTAGDRPATGKPEPAAPASSHAPSPPAAAAAASEPGDPLVELPEIRPLAEMRSGLRSLADAAASIPADSPSRENMAAALRLRMYRFLCGLPEEDITLDDGLSLDARAAAEACRRLGKLTHFPENPGMPADEYERARRGAGSGNLASGITSLVKAMDGWMDDSDAANIKVLGHRRWCLNPSLRRVGFGRSEGWCAMWAHDMSGTAAWHRRAICYPPPGHVPIELFRPHHAWSVTLNPRFFQKPQPGDVSVTVCPRSADGVVGAAMPLEHCGVDTNGCGIDNCIIFRPRDLSTAVGKRYVVTVAGAKNHDSRPQRLIYEVEFCER
jgi:hypothetical protein